MLPPYICNAPRDALQGIPQLQARRDRVDVNYYATMDRIERNGFNGPPESTKEYVHAASKALRVGNWEECASFILE